MRRTSSNTLKKDYIYFGKNTVALMSDTHISIIHQQFKFQRFSLDINCCDWLGSNTTAK